MPRTTRIKSETGIYHIMMRGNNRQQIFEDDEDREKFLETIQRYKGKCKYEIYSYCLMGNHLHILLKIGIEPLEQILRRICGSYVYWYNRKYDRIGNLFQGRYKSEVVETDAYLLTAIRYIHQNPIKASLVKRLEDYKWSSYTEYINESKKSKTCNTDFILSILQEKRSESIRSFIEFNEERNSDICLEYYEKHKITDEEAGKVIQKACKVKHATDLQSMDKSSRDKHLRKLKNKHRLSIRQIERLTGINRGIVIRA